MTESSTTVAGPSFPRPVILPTRSDPSLAESASPTETQRSKPAQSEPPRARASRACSSCNRQKQRCDGQLPCSRCITLHHPESCEYLPSLRGKTRKRKVRPEPSAKKRRSTTALYDDDDDDDSVEEGGHEEDGRIRANQMDGQFSNWKRDNAMADKGPTNSVLWSTSERRQTHGVRDRLTTLPLPGDAHNPLAVLAEASATAHTDDADQTGEGRLKLSVKENPMGISGQRQEDQDGNGVYYAPLQRVLKEEAPHIMRFINVHEAEQLFDMYYKYLHPHLPFLDREHSGPASLARRSNYLFNAVCCSAARAFNIVLWGRLKEFARFEMERMPREKNIDVVQGHLIYATWNLNRPRLFEQDQTWLRTGLAVRTALDINIHRVALVRAAREGLPYWLLRTIIRTWLLAYALDGTLSAQLGKPSSLRGETSVETCIKLLEGDAAGGQDDWQSASSKSEDLWVAALAEWTQILTRANDAFRADASLRSVPPSPAGSPRRAPAYLAHHVSFSPFPDLCSVFSRQFSQWLERTSSLISRLGLEGKQERDLVASLKMYERYAKLIVCSFGLQKAAGAGDRGGALAGSFTEYTSAAILLIQSFQPDAGSPGLTRGTPDLNFSILTYAVVSLLKCLQPQYAHLEPNRQSILHMARGSADALARAAMTPDHLPASQSIFLSRLIDAREAQVVTPSGTRLGPAASALATAPEWKEPSMADFERFGEGVERDQAKSLWPPMPSPSNTMNPLSSMLGSATSPQTQAWESLLNSMAAGGGLMSTSPSTGITPFNNLDSFVLSNMGPATFASNPNDGTLAIDTVQSHSSSTADAGANPSVTSGPDTGMSTFVPNPPASNLSSWLEQNQFSVPGAALGLGAGDSFETDGMSLMGLYNEWKSILERPTGAQNELV